MDTQNTPVHIRLWNHDFWLLAFANMLLTMGVYMQMMYVPEWVKQYSGGGDMQIWTWVAYVVGLFSMGGFCSFLVQKYRRNRVCLQSLIVVMALLASPVFLDAFYKNNVVWTMPLLRFLTGAFFGLAQMVLASTLVIDCCEAPQRTEANYSTAWFYRFSLSLGPLLALMLFRFADMKVSIWVSAGLVALAFVLISLVRFPFRTPEDSLHRFSLDRFLLPGAWALFFQLLLVTMVLGMMMSVFFTFAHFFAWLMLGFLLALLAEKFVFMNAELQSEMVTGLLLMMASLLLMLTNSSDDVMYIVPVLTGLGTGLIGSRFILFFIKLSDHCQRGTSQSTYFLAWESGIALGLGLGFQLVREQKPGESVDPWLDVYVVALVMTVVALVVYVGFTHKWYLRHKNR